jgi:daunorubicin resistance ABC transporter membrane protein
VNGLAHDARTVAVLWARDLRRFARDRGRVAGAIAQPLLFWLAFGAGMAPSFRLGDGGPGYMTFLFPGVVLMLVLFASISSTMSLIEDRHQGFLQGVLAGPGSRGAVALGKSLGSATVAMLQAVLLLALVPLAGFPYREVAWLALLGELGLLALALGALGFCLAWKLDSSAAYHAVMGIVLVPLWMLSGSLFPVDGLHPILAWIVRFNPLSYGVAGVRRALHGGEPPAGTAIGPGGGSIEWIAEIAFAAFCVALAAWVASRRERR